MIASSIPPAFRPRLTDPEVQRTARMVPLEQWTEAERSTFDALHEDKERLGKKILVVEFGDGMRGLCFFAKDALAPTEREYQSFYNAVRFMTEITEPVQGSA